MTDRYADWLPVVPAKGELKETAAALLALAGDPALVRTDGNGTTFLVPEAIALAYVGQVPAKPRRARKKTEPKIETED